MLLACDGNFTSSLPIWIPFISFSCLIALTRPSNTMLNRTWWEWDPCSCSRFQWESFQLFIIVYYVGCGFVINSFYWDMLRYVSFIPTLVRVFYHKWLLNFVRFFSASVEMIIWFLLLMCCVTFFDLHMLNHPCDPGMNPVWSKCMTLFICNWIQFANILLRIFSFVFIKDIGL